MTVLALVLSSLTVVLMLLLLVLVFVRGGRPASRGPSPDLTLMQQQLDGLRQQVADSLYNSASQLTQQLHQVTQHVNQQLGLLTQQFQGTTESITRRLDKAAEVISGVQKGLGELSGSTQQILDVGKDLAQLQQILRAPKLRGGLGEMLLTELIAQILPQEHYQLQYRFRSGETVDAIIRLGPGMVPVDAKFPLENFRKLQAAASETEALGWRRAFTRDVKRHIDTVANKYILPDEGTFDFALLYIPAENVYYETIIKDDASETEPISSYAIRRKVIPVSPNSFYAYLQVIVVGLRGLQIEKRADQIMALLGRLSADFAKFREDFTLLGKHLTNARSKYEDSEKRLLRFEDRLTSAGTQAPPELEAGPDRLSGT